MLYLHFCLLLDKKTTIKN